MKVLHIYREKNDGIIGGVENHIKYLTEEQFKLGITPIVLVLKSAEKNSIIEKKINNITYFYLEEKEFFYNLSKYLKPFETGGIGFLITGFDRLKLNLKISKKILLINTIDPDLIHQHDYLSSVRLSKTIPKKFKKVFTNHYGEFLLLKQTVLTRIIQNYFLNHFNSIIASSTNLLHKKCNSFFIQNGVDIENFKEISAAEKQQLKNQQTFKNKVVFLCARRWAPNKGILYLVKALNLLSDEVKQKAIFLFAGNEIEDYELYRKQVQNELDKSVGLEFKLFGNLNHTELISILNICDIGIIPSLVEGMSLNSIELISCGIPVLATNVGGLPEVITNNENGWLVPSKDSNALASEISRIVINWPETKLNIKTTDFREKYSWKSIANKTIEIYKINENISSNWH